MVSGEQFARLADFVPDRSTVYTVDCYGPSESAVLFAQAFFSEVDNLGEYPEPNSPDEVPGDATVPEEPNTEVHNDPVPEEEE